MTTPEMLGRQLKAVHMVAVILAEVKACPELLDHCGAMSYDWWVAVAEKAGHPRRPTEKTIQAVLEILGNQVEESHADVA